MFILAGNPSQSDVIVEGKNYVNGYHFCNRLSKKKICFFASYYNLAKGGVCLLVSKGPDKMRCGSAGLPKLLSGWLNQACKLLL